jgi:hypothetical protein
MKDVISTLAIQTIMDDYAVKGAASIYAPFVVADPANVVGVSRINVPQLNLNGLKTDGVDFELDYLVPEDLIPGRMSFRALGTWTDVFRTITTTNNINSAGTAGTPKMAWNILMSYDLDDWGVDLMTRYTSPLTYDPTLVGLDGLAPGTAEYNATAARSNSINRNTWPAALYYNASAHYDLVSDEGKRLQLYLNVDNIWNKKPPIIAISINGSPYDLVGRSFKLGVRARY